MSCSYLLDTSVILDSFRKPAIIPQKVERGETIFLSQIVIGELMVGLDGTRRGRMQRTAFDAFTRLPNVVEITLTSATTDLYAKVFRSLREVGRPIPTNDIWLAAQALEHGAVLVSRDRHFDAVANLRTMILED